jgi:hypothetical protein
MYWWKNKMTKKVSFIPDHQVYFDPKEYFKGENIESWCHRRDDDFVIDMFYTNENLAE